MNITEKEQSYKLNSFKSFLKQDINFRINEIIFIII